MFVTGTNVARKGTTQLLANLALLSSMRIVAVDRSGLRYNWWFAPASTAPPTGWIGFQFVLRGELSIPGQAAHGERVAWLYAEDDFEGSLNTRRHGFCSHGEPFQSVAVHVHPSWSSLPLPAGGVPQRLVTPRSVFVACEQYLDTIQRHAPPAEWAAAVRTLCDSLKTSGWLAPEVNVATAMERDARISDVLGKIIGRFDPSAQLAELADRIDTTPRRVDRLLRSWMAQHGLPSESWRSVTRRWRLKMAVLLSSSQDYSVSEVAKLVGYTSTNSLTNAFAAEGLQPPSWYRTADLISMRPSPLELSRSREK
jgi:AraC-like DNA-binding protein